MMIETYDYLEAVKQDVLAMAADWLPKDQLRALIASDEDAAKVTMCYKAMNDDAVTGCPSGSYTFSTYQAEKNLLGNWELLEEALDELDEHYVSPISKGAEWCDSTIRCYLVPIAVDQAIKTIMK